MKKEFMEPLFYQNMKNDKKVFNYEEPTACRSSNPYV